MLAPVLAEPAHAVGQGGSRLALLRNKERVAEELEDRLRGPVAAHGRRGQRPLSVSASGPRARPARTREHRRDRPGELADAGGGALHGGHRRHSVSRRGHVEAGLLAAREVGAVLERMRANREAVGAGSIGLTVYPVYPEGFFKNPQVRPFGYQNGGDWTWFGGRTIQHLVGLGARARGRRPPVIRRIPATSPPPADRPPRARGLAGRVEDLHHGEVDRQRRQVGGRHGRRAPHDRGQVGERLVGGRRRVGASISFSASPGR